VRRPLLAVVLLAAGCGGGGGGGGPGTLAGTYAVDVAATFGVPSEPTPGDSPAAAGVRERFSPAAFRLELAGGGLFSLSLVSGPDALVVEGTWSVVPDGVELAATTVNGAPATPEERAPDTLRREGDGLVLDRPDGGPVVWRR
jgi:hypothetical protein